MKIYEIFNQTLGHFKLKARTIAAESGATETTLSKWRNGEKAILDDTLQRFLDALPDDAYCYFCTQLLLQRQTPHLAVQLLIALASKVETGEVVLKPEILNFLIK